MDRPAGRKTEGRTGFRPENRPVLIKEYAYRLLSRFIYSEKALFGKLSQKFPGCADEIGAIIEELKGYRYIDDSRYAVFYRDQLTARGYGPAYVRSYLSRKGFPVPEAADTGDRMAAMEKWFLRKAGKTDILSPKKWQRIFSYLKSKGFGTDDVLEFMRSKRFQEQGPEN